MLMIVPLLLAMMTFTENVSGQRLSEDDSLELKIGQMIMVDLVGPSFDAYTKEQMAAGESGKTVWFELSA